MANQATLEIEEPLGEAAVEDEGVDPLIADIACFVEAQHGLSYQERISLGLHMMRNAHEITEPEPGLWNVPSHVLAEWTVRHGGRLVAPRAPRPFDALPAPRAPRRRRSRQRTASSASSDDPSEPPPPAAAVCGGCGSSFIPTDRQQGRIARGERVYCPGKGCAAAARKRRERAAERNGDGPAPWTPEECDLERELAHYERRRAQLAHNADDVAALREDVNRLAAERHQLLVELPAANGDTPGRLARLRALDEEIERIWVRIRVGEAVAA